MSRPDPSPFAVSLLVGSSFVVSPLAVSLVVVAIVVVAIVAAPILPVSMLARPTRLVEEMQMSVNVEVVAVAHMHGVTDDIRVGKTLDANGKVAFDEHTGLVLDELVAQFASVRDVDATAASASATDCRALALQTVQARLGAEYTVSNAPLDSSGVHIWVPREGWQKIDDADAISHAFVLQVASSLGPVDQRSVFYVNGRLLAVDILIVVQAP